MSVKERRPIRILFASCPKLNVDACEYLILSQNKIQDVFEFEVYRLALSGQSAASSRLDRALKRWSQSDAGLPLKTFAEHLWYRRLEKFMAPSLFSVLSRSTGINQVKNIVAQHNQWLQSLSRNYGNWTLRDGPTIVITETRIEGGYLALATDGVAIISLSEWNNKKVQTSVLEYTLTQVHRYALRLELIVA